MFSSRSCAFTPKGFGHATQQLLSPTGGNYSIFSQVSDYHCNDYFCTNIRIVLGMVRLTAAKKVLVVVVPPALQLACVFVKKIFNKVEGSAAELGWCLKYCTARWRAYIPMASRTLSSVFKSVSNKNASPQRQLRGMPRPAGRGSARKRQYTLHLP